jgi:hypothetical protein
MRAALDVPDFVVGPTGLVPRSVRGGDAQDEIAGDAVLVPGRETPALGVEPFVREAHRLRQRDPADIVVSVQSEPDEPLANVEAGPARLPLGLFPRRRGCFRYTTVWQSAKL